VCARAFLFFRAPKKAKSVSARMNETRDADDAKESFFFRGETTRARSVD